MYPRQRVSMRKIVLFLSVILVPAMVLAEPARRPGTATTEKPASTAKPATRPNSTPSTKPATRPNAQPSQPSTTVKAPKITFDKPAAIDQSKEESKKKFTQTTPPPVVRTPNYQPTPSRPPVVVTQPAQRPNAQPNNKSTTTVVVPNIVFDREAANDKAREEHRERPYIPPTPPKPPQRTITITQEQYDSRPQRLEQHYKNYNTYNNLPPVNVGGGYSSIFWYSMINEWDYQRRAIWLYNHQKTIDAALYQQELAKNAALKAEIDRLNAANTPINPNYVDAEYVGKEDLMLANSNVYRPVDLTPLFYVLGVFVGLAAIAGFVYLFFFKKWNL